MEEEIKVEETIAEAVDEAATDAVEEAVEEAAVEEAAEELFEEAAEEAEAVKPDEPAAQIPAEEEIGNIKISVDVVSTIAGIATTDIQGVAYMYSSFAGGIAERFGAKKVSSKGVKVDMTDTAVSIDLYIVVDYGVRIPELAWEIQENVKNNVETMTGLAVNKVNIHIEGVNFPPEDNGSKELEAPEQTEELPEPDTEE